jgi:hypothetical protein
MSSKRNKKSKQRQLVNYSVSKISLLHSDLNFPDHFQISPTDNLNYNFEVNFSIDKSNSILKIVINYEFLVNEIKVLDLKVQNNYNVRQLGLIFSGAEFDPFIIFLIELSVDHTRGIQSTLIKGTPIDNFYIPVIQRDKIRAKLSGTIQS